MKSYQVIYDYVDKEHPSSPVVASRVIFAPDITEALKKFLHEWNGAYDEIKEIKLYKPTKKK